MAVKSNIKQVKEQMHKAFAEIYTEKMVDILSKYAATKLKQAYDEHEFTNNTYNLKDSYFWAIYHQGSLKKYGFLGSVSATYPHRPYKKGDSPIEGRETAKKYIYDYKASPSNFFEVIIGVSIYYGAWVEEGTKNNRKFIVLSSIFEDVVADMSQVGTVIWETTYPNGDKINR